MINAFVYHGKVIFLPEWVEWVCFDDDYYYIYGFEDKPVIVNINYGYWCSLAGTKYDCFGFFDGENNKSCDWSLSLVKVK